MMYVLILKKKKKQSFQNWYILGWKLKKVKNDIEV